MKRFFPFIVLVVLLTSCNAYEKVAYVQQAGSQAVFDDKTKPGIPDVTLKAGDLLTITVNSNVPEAAAPFNLPLIPGGESMKNYSIGNSTISGGGGLQNYLVDHEGNVVFPIIGKIHAAGMTKSELAEKIKSSISPAYIKEEPIVLIRYANYRISVLGEVARPGMLSVNNERLSIFEAISMAGDLTVYGRRDNVLIIRENNKGERETVRIDLRDSKLIDSEYYYLQQNDVLYVQPNNQKARSTFIGQAETLSLSVVSTLISITTLVVTLIRK
jgi:polysaccharide export outer membrane protein